MGRADSDGNHPALGPRRVQHANLPQAARVRSAGIQIRRPEEARAGSDKSNHLPVRYLIDLFFQSSSKSTALTAVTTMELEESAVAASESIQQSPEDNECLMAARSIQAEGRSGDA